MAAELEPTVKLAVVGQQHMGFCRIDYPGRGGEVPHVVVPLLAAILFCQEGQRGGDGLGLCRVEGGVGGNGLGAFVDFEHLKKIRHLGVDKFASKA